MISQQSAIATFESTGSNVNENTHACSTAGTSLSQTSNVNDINDPSRIDSTMAQTLQPFEAAKTPMPDNSLSTALNSSLNINPVKTEPVFDQLNETDQQIAEDVFNLSYENCGSDDDVMVERNVPLPMPAGVKKNDVLTGNKPYAVNASSDRSYIQSQGNSWTPITLTNRIIKGLAAFNVGSLRTSPSYDRKFIKVLIVATIGVDNLKSGKIDPLKVSFIEGKN